jgi:RNA polymerase sigma factor for flagellar operon FliA
MEDFFRANLELIDRIVGRVCRRARVFGADAEDFESTVHMHLIEDDYSVLRKYEGRSSLAAFLTVVIQRLLVDERTRSLGRWHPSTEAKRLGEAAVLLETLTLRDRRSLDEALPMVQSIDPTITREKAKAIAARLPERTIRPRAVDVDETPADLFVATDSADIRVVENDSRRLSADTSRVVRDVLGGWSVDDRMLVKLRFAQSMSIADIARMMRLPQRPLYRRLESLLEKLKDALAKARLDPAAITDLVGSGGEAIDFGWREAKVDENDDALSVIHDRGPERAREPS